MTAFGPSGPLASKGNLFLLPHRFSHRALTRQRQRRVGRTRRVLTRRTQNTITFVSADCRSACDTARKIFALDRPARSIDIPIGVSFLKEATSPKVGGTLAFIGFLTGAVHRVFRIPLGAGSCGVGAARP